MSGVRMGERVLQVGVNDPRLAGTIAAKVGLSGHAAMAVADERSADRANRGAVDAGGLIDVHVTPLQTLPFPEQSFDVVIINTVDGLLAGFDEGMRARVLRECHRVVRKGGRVIAIEAGPRTGLAARFLRPAPPANPDYETRGGTVGAFQAAGFRPVRLLAEREGYRFIEGLRT
jgi:SAM-dependent methyltransferase